MTVESGLDGLARKGCFWTDVSELVCGKTAHKPVLSIIISVNYSWPLLLPFFFLMPHLLIGSFFIWFTLPLLETRSPTSTPWFFPSARLNPLLHVSCLR